MTSPVRVPAVLLTLVLGAGTTVAGGVDVGKGTPDEPVPRVARALRYRADGTDIVIENGPRPPRINLGSGWATLLDLPLDPKRELRSIAVRCLANEVVVGLMSDVGVSAILFSFTWGVLAADIPPRKTYPPSCNYPPHGYNDG